MSVPAQTPITGPYTANGNTKQFAYTFYLLQETDLVVFLGGVKKTLHTDYEVTGIGQTQGGNVVFTINPPQGVQVLLKRQTPYTRNTDYADNGDLLADVLNQDFDRLWLSLQEINANFSSSISRPVGGDWDADLHRITRVSDGVNAQDAVTFNQLFTVNGSAGTSAAAASQSASVAAEQAGAASNAAATATSAASVASTSASDAQKWAANPIDSVVANGLFSARHYASKAADSATSAGASESTATSAASTATGAAGTATAAATTAGQQADRAATEASKLGNMNDLAAAIKSVNTATSEVVFKGPVVSTGSMKSVNTSGATLWGFGADGKVTTPFGQQLDVSNTEFSFKSGSIWSRADRDFGTQHFGGSIHAGFGGGRGSWSGGDPLGAYISLLPFQDEAQTGRASGILRWNGFGSSYDWKFDNDGVARSPVANGWQSASDERTKDKITRIKNAMAILKAGRGVTWNSLLKGAEGKTGIGLVIQDLLPYFEFIGESRSYAKLSNGETVSDCLTMDTGAVGVAVLWEVCTELLARLEALEDR